MSIYLEVDGKPEPIANCVWLTYARCGCLSGVMTAATRTWTIATAEQADKIAHEDDNADWARKHDEGTRTVPDTFEHYRTLSFGDCPHEPKWGLTPRPDFEGFEWAIENGSWAGKQQRWHLFPVGSGERDSLCGKKDYGFGLYKTGNPGGRFDCTRCLAKAVRQFKAVSA